MRHGGSTFAVVMDGKGVVGESYWSKAKAIREARKARKGHSRDVWIENEQTGVVVWGSWWQW